MIQFKTITEAEQYLEQEYVNKILQVKYYTQQGQFPGEKTYVGKLDRLAIDAATKNTPIIILIFNDGNRFEIEKDEFFDLITRLN